MAERRIDQLIQLALAAAAERDFGERELGPIHLLKYAYLGDLAYASTHGGATYTEAPWKFHHFGPWSVPVFQRIEPAAAAVGAKMRRFVGRYQDDNLRWSVDDGDLLDRLEGDLPWQVSRAIKLAVRRYGADTVSLLHHAYHTGPMLNSAPGEALDFTVVEGETKMRQRVVATPPALPSKTAAKKLRARVQEKLAAARSRRLVQPEPMPRYDELFAQGVEWLDSLAGRPVELTAGRISFDESIWRSAARRERDLP